MTTKPIEQVKYLESKKYWYGLGHWNFYFLLKMSLFLNGTINFHLYENILFVAFLVFPLPIKILHQVRGLVSIFLGIALLYFDSWLPSFRSVLSNSNVLMSFQMAYLFELLGRFINWSLMGMIFIGFTIYLYLVHWIRISTITVLSLAYLALQPLLMPILDALHTEFQYVEQDDALEVFTQNSIPKKSSALTVNNVEKKLAASGVVMNSLERSAVPSNQNLNEYLIRFYEQQSKQRVQFPDQMAADAQPFDLLVINICSLSNDDLLQVGLSDHSLWKHFDIKFNQFNSATSYSGPAAIRLLRASCGQTEHASLYKDTDKECYLFENLDKLGFEKRLVMDHSGEFEDYLKQLNELAALKVEPQSAHGLVNDLVGFDGAPIYRDDLVLDRWLTTRQEEKNIPRTATFMNMIALHDGNRYVTNNNADYKSRAQILFDQLDHFLTNLEKSGRKVVVAIVPEHGAALSGDRMQISGLRDIPNLNITRVPAGIKLVGIKAAHATTPLVVEKNVSYIAISEMVKRLLDGKIFTQETINWQALVEDLPETVAVSENENAIVLEYQAKPYVKLNGGDWIPYPQ